MVQQVVSRKGTVGLNLTDYAILSSHHKAKESNSKLTLSSAFRESVILANVRGCCFGV